MKTYLALTIGPIYKTLALAKRTRELWAASYVFSFLMEEIVKIFDSERQFEIIIPIKMEKSADVKTGAGLYPDRLIIKVNFEGRINQADVLKDFNTSITKIRDEFIGNASEIIDRTSIESQNFLKNYFQFYGIIVQLSDQEDPIKSIFPLLDTLEQQAAFNPKFTNNSVKNFLASKNLRGSFLYKTAFINHENGADNKIYRFPSVLEIAVQDLRKKEKFFFPDLIEDYKPNLDIFDRIFEYCFEKEGQKVIIDKKEITVDDTFAITLLKKAYNPENATKDDEQFRHYHKYMAVVQADGDDMGKLLRALFEYGGTEAIQSFSGFLIEFGYEASKIIKKEYEGIPVYLGGDDMLFFAPIKNGDKNIFMLIDQLDRLFKDSLRDNTIVLAAIAGWNKGLEWDKERKKVGLPTISYGVALSYHKYPLKEDIEAARSLLFDIAKHFPGKNAISFRLLKHSGHYIGTSLNKHWRTWKAFDELLNNKNLNKTFLSSIQFNLEPLRPVLRRVLTGRKIDFKNASFKELSLEFLPDEGNREYLLKNLSDNFFNEGVKHNDSREFIETVLALLLQTFRDMEDSFGNQPETADRAIDSLYACLRIMQFFNQPDNKEDEE